MSADPDPQASGSGRPKRNKVVKIQAQASTIASGYAAFEAEESSDSGDGSQSTAVTLWVSGKPYEGATGVGGHAEMNALLKVLADLGDLDTVIATGGKTVECTAKPCCYRCSVVLGLLGFSAHSDDTTKTRSGMGGTQWAMPADLKRAVMAKYGDVGELMSFYGNVDKFR